MEENNKLTKIRNLFFGVAGAEARKWRRHENSRVTSVNLYGNINFLHKYVIEGDYEGGNTIFNSRPSEAILKTDFNGECYEIWFGPNWLCFKTPYQVKEETEAMEDDTFTAIMLRFFNDIADEATYEKAEALLK